MGTTFQKLPHLQLERDLLARGHELIAGLDEAGRGAWAGPVVAAAVVLPLRKANLGQILNAVRDSKLLTASRREELLPLIGQVSLSIGIGVVPAAVVDRGGITAATRCAMHDAIRDLSLAPDYLLIDWLPLHDIAIPQQAMPKGDRDHLSIAAASIVAKVTRDRILRQMDSEYPGYGFAQHKGYGTAQHATSLAKLGPCAVHRHSFSPVCASLRR